MEYFYKNPVKNVDGSIDCFVFIDDQWLPHTQDSSFKYELHSESEWHDCKPCPQAKIDAHNRLIILEQISALDLSLHTIERALAGDSIALEKIQANELKKQELRDLL